MSDSEPKVPEIDITSPGEFLPPPEGAIEVVMRNKDGTTRKVLKKDGKFIKRQRPMPEAKEITRMMRTLLSQPETGPDGKIAKGEKTRFRKMFDNMVAIASNGDPEFSMSAIKAFEVLMARGYGKVTPSDQELDALSTAGIKVIVVPPPSNMMYPEQIEERKERAKSPAFIEGTVVEQN